MPRFNNGSVDRRHEGQRRSEPRKRRNRRANSRRERTLYEGVTGMAVLLHPATDAQLRGFGQRSFRSYP